MTTSLGVLGLLAIVSCGGVAGYFFHNEKDKLCALSFGLGLLLIACFMVAIK